MSSLRTKETSGVDLIGRGFFGEGHFGAATGPADRCGPARVGAGFAGGVVGACLCCVGFKFEALPCQPNTFHHIPNLTSPLGLDSGLGKPSLVLAGAEPFLSLAADELAGLFEGEDQRRVGHVPRFLRQPPGS